MYGATEQRNPNTVQSGCAFFNQLFPPHAIEELEKLRCVIRDHVQKSWRRHQDPTVGKLYSSVYFSAALMFIRPTYLIPRSSFLILRRALPQTVSLSARRPQTTAIRRLYSTNSTENMGEATPVFAEKACPRASDPRPLFSLYRLASK